MIFESAEHEEIVIDNRNHSFPVAVAMKYSPQMALWLQHLSFWTEQHLALQKNIHDGLCWNYTTIEALGDQFPYLSKSQRETMINNSIKEGLVIKGNYNQTKYDRTVWYALTPKAYAFFAHLLNEKYLKRLYSSISEKSEMDFVKFRNQFPKIRTPIPNSNNNSNNNSNSDSVESAPISNDQILEAYHEVLPECPKVKVIDRKLRAQLDSMRNMWHKYQKDGKPFSLESFKDYLHYLREHYSWFLKPYKTPTGSTKRNNLRTITREINITKIVNGEFSAS